MATTANKRIAISEETWKRLGDMKQAGQTYDELITELIHKANRLELAKRAEKAGDMDEEELVSLDSDSNSDGDRG